MEKNIEVHVGRSSKGTIKDRASTRDEADSVQEASSVKEDSQDPKFSMTKDEMAACIAETNQNVEVANESQDLANQMLKAMEKEAKALAKDSAALQARLSSLVLSASTPESLHSECGPAELDQQLKEFESDADQILEAYESCVAKLTGDYHKAVGEGASFLSTDVVSAITNRIKEMMDLAMAVSKMEEEVYEAALLEC